MAEPTTLLPIHLGTGLELCAAEVAGQAVEWEETGNDQALLKLVGAVQGRVELRLRFCRGLGLEDVGFYLCEYKGDLMAVTHFKPNYARLAFPCFDEPHLRSVFRLTIKVQPEFYQCFSNMPLLTRLGDTFQFHPTPAMPTYLLNWCICNHQSISVFSLQQVPISIYNRRVKHCATYLKLAQEALDFCVDYFDLPYPLPKLDIMAVYSNLQPAMRGRASEAWGVIAALGRHIEHRESDIAAAFSRNSRTICHEIVHMWIGNLATINWWTSFWLVESLARFVEHKILATLRPEFRIWEKCQREIIHPALDVDGSDASKAMEIEVEDPSQLDSIYDPTAYGRGMAVIAMAEELIGPENFRQGLSGFLKAYAYNSFDSSQFWGFLAKYGDYPDLPEIVQPWVDEPGFPLLLVSKTESGTIRVQQRKFVNLLEHQKPGCEKLWPVPLTYLSSAENSQRKVLLRDYSVDLNLGPELKWFACNIHRLCFLRVHYTDELLIALAEPIRNQRLSTIDIYGILNDHFLYYRSGGTKYQTLKTLLLASAWCQEMIMCEEWLEIIRYFWRFLAGRHLFRQEVQSLTRALFEGCLNPSSDCIYRDSIIGLALRAMTRICEDSSTIARVCTSFLSASGSFSAELYQVHAELFFCFSPLESVLAVMGSDLRLQYMAAQTGNEAVLKHLFAQFISGHMHGLRFAHIDSYTMLRVMLQMLIESSASPEKWQQVKQSSFSNVCVDAMTRCMGNIHARRELEGLLELFDALEAIQQKMRENWLSALVNCKIKLTEMYSAHQRAIDPLQTEILTSTPS